MSGEADGLDRDEKIAVLTSVLETAVREYLPVMEAQVRERVVRHALIDLEERIEAIAEAKVRDLWDQWLASEVGHRFVVEVRRA